MTTKTIWRLGKLPTPEEVAMLQKQDLITKDEAREILISKEDDEERDADSLKEEIKFLRELVQKLSNRSEIVKQIEYIQQPYYRYDWYRPYVVYCNTGNGISYTTTTSGLSTGTLTTAAYTDVGNAAYTSSGSSGDDQFTAISTF